MKTLKFLHAADLHLDAPFRSLPGEKAAVCRGEQRLLLNRLAKLAEEEAVDFVLLSGDLLDGENLYFETGQQLLRCLRDMTVPVYIAPGSHDPYTVSGFYARAALPDNVHVFPTQEITCVEEERTGTLIYGAAFTGPSCPPLLRGFHARPETDRRQIMCLYGDAEHPNSAKNPITEDEIADTGLDYLALGHGHTASGLRKAEKTFYAWPGCAEGHSFAESGEKTVSVITLNGEECTEERYCVSSRRYMKMSVDVTGTDPLLAVNTALPEDPARDIYRITLTGQTAQAPKTGLLRAALEDLFFELQLKDATGLSEDLWQKASEDSLRGRFLRTMRKQYEQARDEAARRRVESAARWGLAALDGKEEVNPHEDQPT